MSAPGRSCPLHYRYAPAVFDVPPPAELQGLDVLYVVGGLYGNELALQAVLRLFERERGRARLLFNGDFHWFDAEAAAFARVQREVLAFDALRGNVETELAAAVGSPMPAAAAPIPNGSATRWSSAPTASCSGCARAPRHGTVPSWRALPMWQRASVGGLQLGIVHGDAQSLAGWGFAQEHLRDAAHRQTVQGWFDAAKVDAFACTHTCLPVFQRIGGAAAPRWVLNNGAAGMPNFRGDDCGAADAFRAAAVRRRRTPLRGALRRGVHRRHCRRIDASTWRAESSAPLAGGQ